MLPQMRRVTNTNLLFLVNLYQSLNGALLYGNVPLMHFHQIVSTFEQKPVNFLEYVREKHDI